MINVVKWSKRSVIELAAILGMVAVVGTLALLQYRWTGEISRSQQQRLTASLGTSIRGFEQEFSYDFERLCEAFESDPEAPPSGLETRILHQQTEWQRIASRPAMLARIDLLQLQEGHSSLESFTPDGQRFAEPGWPQRLESLRLYLERQAQLLNARVIGDRQALYYPWAFHGETAALVRPVFHIENKQEMDVGLQGFLILELNRDFLKQQYLPELVTRHFGEPAFMTFAVMVGTANPASELIYTSNPTSADSDSEPDATVNLFDSVAEEARRRGHPPVQTASGSKPWQLIVQDPVRSVNLDVAKWRRRNLAISFGLLAALAGTMVLLFSVAQRSERLAKLQMEFVAGVSHELCTPLAVINSAAENIVDGVVEGSEQVRQYGTLIREQARRLERLVDEVLLFAAGRVGRAGFDLRPTELAPLLELSLGACEAMLRDAGFTLQKEINRELPAVITDPEALCKCLENLISNAMKYSGENRWVAVRATLSPDSASREVRLSVEDNGIGISPADLPHVFEPFYRGQAVRDGQARGAGLGLYLVKRMTEAMGGGVSVSSKAGKGSVFTLHLPVCESPEPRETHAAPEIAKA